MHPAFVKAARKLDLDEEQRAMLVQQIAPFAAKTAHQLPIGAEGQTLVGHSVGTLTVSKPASIPDGTPWGFHVFTQPTVGAGYDGSTGLPGVSPAQLITHGDLITGTQLAAGPEALFQAPVVLICFRMDELPLTIGKITTFVADRFQRFVEPALIDPKTPCILTALSYKVVNDTAELEKQGSKLAYRQACVPAMRSLKAPITNLGITEWYGLAEQMTLFVPYPPVSPATATPHNSVVGAAADGDLEVQPFDYNEMQLQQSRIGSFVYDSDYGASFPVGSSLGTGRQSQPTSSAPTETGVWCCRVFAEERVGTFFTGLGDGSNFTISIHCVVESAPTTESPNIKYASVPPPRDNRLLLAATVAARTYPVGLPARANSFGSFLKGALGTVTKLFHPVKEIASTAANILPGRLGAIANAIGTGMEVGEKIFSSGSRPKPSAPSRAQVALTTSAPRGGKVSLSNTGTEEVIRIPNARLAASAKRR